MTCGHYFALQNYLSATLQGMSSRSYSRHLIPNDVLVHRRTLNGRGLTEEREVRKDWGEKSPLKIPLFALRPSVGNLRIYP